MTTGILKRKFHFFLYNSNVMPMSLLKKSRKTDFDQIKYDLYSLYIQLFAVELFCHFYSINQYFLLLLKVILHKFKKYIYLFIYLFIIILYIVLIFLSAVLILIIPFYSPFQQRDSFWILLFCFRIDATAVATVNISFFYSICFLM